MPTTTRSPLRARRSPARSVFLAFALLSALLSCDRIERTGGSAFRRARATAGRVRQAAVDRKDRALDAVWPFYDSDRPDTRSNRKRFKDHLQVDPTADVRNIYAYGDFLGIDYKVLLAFSCDPATIDKIVAVKHMQRVPASGMELHFQESFPWWSRDRSTLPEPYRVGEEGAWWQYLWYDPKTKRAFYEEYSL